MNLQLEFDIVCKIAKYWMDNYGLDEYTLTLAICIAPGGSISGSRGMIEKMIATGKVLGELAQVFTETVKENRNEMSKVRKTM